MTGRSPAVGRLHVIVTPTPDEPRLELTEAVLGAGAPVVQLRVKGVDDPAWLRLVEDHGARCRAHDALLIVNDRADICVAAGADGVHGGADDLPVPARRVVVGPGRLVGGTARSVDQARNLERGGADYLGVGPVFATTTKAGLPTPIGLDTLAEVCAAVTIPVVAIAGITVERVPDILAAGAHGVAVVSAVADAPDPAAATRAFLDALELAVTSSDDADEVDRAVAR